VNNADKLTITAGPFRSKTGQVLVVLHNQDPMTGPGVSYQVLEITGDEIVAEFFNIPYGEYAAVVIHDENRNQNLDFAGNRPSEGIGTSGRNKPFEGPPVFDACKFRYGPEQNTVYIPLCYSDIPAMY